MDELSRRLSPKAGACGCGGVADRLPAVYCSSKSSAMAALPVDCCGRDGGGGSPHRLKGSSGDCCAAVFTGGAAADPADAVCWCGIAALLKGSSSTAGSRDNQLRGFAVLQVFLSRALSRNAPDCSGSCGVTSAVESCADEPLKQIALVETQHLPTCCTQTAAQ
jgi:hypothetical protein